MSHHSVKSPKANANEIRSNAMRLESRERKHSLQSQHKTSSAAREKRLDPSLDQHTKYTDQKHLVVPFVRHCSTKRTVKLLTSLVKHIYEYLCVSLSLSIACALRCRVHSISPQRCEQCHTFILLRL